MDTSASEPLVHKGDVNTPPFRVLVVDDNRDAADSTAQLLTIAGFDARACYDGPSALAVADDFRPGICFLDLNMPGMGGEELALRLRDRAGGRPLVLAAVTAMSAPEFRERTAAAGFDLHLVKPVDPFQLVEVVDTLFRTWSPVGASTGAR
ncbi:MAG TPA: response regulator [Gemmataceae bacterium]|nr:response regulator [Gemmataceae bacterium]